MTITMIENGSRFGSRAGAIIYNEAKTKILLENQENKRYMFPGGRIDVGEDSKKAIIRELKEELNIVPEVKLKYVLEMFINASHSKYHEIGFYYIATIKEETVPDKTKNLDGKGIFEWIPINKLNEYKVLATPIQEKIYKNEIENSTLEHIIYREY